MPPYQPYAFPMPTRPASAWGQPEPYADTPQQFELGGVYNRLGNFFGQSGMQSLSVPGILLGIFSKHYQQAAMQGQLEQMKLAKAQMDLNAQQLEEVGQRRMIEYSDVLSEYERAAGQTDPDKIGNFVIDGKTLDQALYEKAQELGDNGGKGILTSKGSVGAVVQYIVVK